MVIAGLEPRANIQYYICHIIWANILSKYSKFQFMILSQQILWKKF